MFALFVCSSLASSIVAYLSDPGDSSAAVLEYDFGLLSTAVGLVYSYGIGVPVLLWLALRYLGVGEWSVVEAIAVWGYGQFVWIPVAVRLIPNFIALSFVRECAQQPSQILCVTWVPIVRWVLVGLGFGLSGWYLAANVYPVLATVSNLVWF